MKNEPFVGEGLLPLSPEEYRHYLSLRATAAAGERFSLPATDLTVPDLPEDLFLSLRRAADALLTPLAEILGLYGRRSSVFDTLTKDEAHALTDVYYRALIELRRGEETITALLVPLLREEHAMTERALSLRAVRASLLPYGEVAREFPDLPESATVNARIAACRAAEEKVRRREERLTLYSREAERLCEEILPAFFAESEKKLGLRDGSPAYASLIADVGRTMQKIQNILKLWEGPA